MSYILALAAFADTGYHRPALAYKWSVHLYSQPITVVNRPLKNELSWTLHKKATHSKIAQTEMISQSLEKKHAGLYSVDHLLGKKVARHFSVCVQRVNSRDIHFSWPPAVAQETVVVAALTRPWTHVFHVSLLCQCFSEKFDNCYRLLMHRVTLGAVRCCQWVVWMKWWW